MATKKKVKTQPSKETEQTEELNDKILPQNIIELGEHTQDEKKVYISQNTYNEIHKFTKDKTTNESGGVLLGNVIEEFGKTHIVIRAFIEAKYCESTPTTLKFTHETWEYIHKEADKKYPDYKILGWIHTHPDFGIFLSEYDKFIQENFFKDEHQIAYVVDPIQNIEGFYFWINEKIERCKGFYVFDKTGVKITAGVEEKTKEEQPAKTGNNSLVQTIAISILGAVAVFLLVMCLSLSSKISTLQTQMQTLVESANSSLSTMSYQINSLYTQNLELESRIAALEPQPEEDTSDDSEKTIVSGEDSNVDEATGTDNTAESVTDTSEESNE